MRIFLLAIAGALALRAGVGPDELRVAYAPYTPWSNASFRAESQLVALPVIVRDPSDHSVNGLARTNFRVFEDRKEREIVSFATETGGSSGPDSAALPPRFIIFLFDDVTMRLGCGGMGAIPDPRAAASVPLMKAAATKFVLGSMGPRDRISIIGINSGQTVEFTNDRNKLLAGIRNVSIRLTCTPFNKMGVLDDVIAWLSRFPGDRSIILCSFRFGMGAPAAMDAITRRAVRSGIPIHTLDMRGNDVQLGDGPLTFLAENTGGRTFRYNNDFDLGLKELATPPSTTYLLGFVPDTPRDGGFHPVKVKLAGGPGYSVQTRPGYFAPGAQDDQPPGERPIDREAAADDIRNELPVTITALYHTSDTGDPAALVVAHIDLKNLPFRQRQDRRVAQLRIVSVLFDTNGGAVAGKEGVIEFALKEESFRDLSQAGLNASLTLAAPAAGSYRLRTVVSDQDGKLTASTASVDIP
jgi:VWFA-related protein